MKTRIFKEKTKKENVLFVSKLVISVVIIVFALLQLLKVWDKATYISSPLLGVLILVQSIQEFKTNRNVAIVSLICALLIFICTIVAICSL